MSDLIRLQQKQIRAERLATEVYNNRINSYDTPSTRFYKLRSIAVKINKAINSIKEEERKNKTIVKKTIGELRAMVKEEKRAIKEAGFSWPLRTI